MNPGHQPQRFQTFQMIPGMQAFKIKDTDYVFQVDKYGGWYDQYGNYYNQHAEPDQPPQDNSSHSASQDSRSYDSGDQSDQFQKEFGRPQNYEDESSDQDKDVQAIALNLSILQTYPKESMVRVYFQNVGHYTEKKQLLEHYSKQVNGILNIILERRGNKNKGQGHFIMSDPVNAQILVNLQGKKIFQRPLYFIVQKYEHFITQPISQEELKKEQKPRYVAKAKIQQKQQKIDNTQSVPWCWCAYKFQRKIFPKKYSFIDWMVQNGFIFGQDFKQIQKIENDTQKKYIKVQMKDTTFKSINGYEYQGKKVEFIPHQ